MLLLGHARTRHKRAESCVHTTSGCIAPLAALGCCKPGHVRAFSNVLLCHLLQRWAEFSRSFASAKELVALLRRPTHGQTLRLTCTCPVRAREPVNATCSVHVTHGGGLAVAPLFQGGMCGSPVLGRRTVPGTPVLEHTGSPFT